MIALLSLRMKCDVCGFNEADFAGTSLNDALSKAQDEGWSILTTSGEVMCNVCLGADYIPPRGRNWFSFSPEQLG